MGPETVLDIGRQALWLAVLLAGPMLGAALAVGLFIGVIQAATQIQEMTLSFIPKLLALVVVLFMVGPWMLRIIVTFSQRLFMDSPGWGGEVMPLSFATILASMTLFAAPFLRLSAMMAVAPVFSAAGFNVRTRALFAVLIAALVAPSLPSPPVDSLLSGAGVLMGIREIGVGLVLGFIVQMAFGAAVFAGQAISMTMGLGFAMAVDPQNGVQVPVISQLYVILATLLFLALDGHLLLIAAVVESYQLIPIGVAGLPVTSLSAVVALGTMVFAGGILLALPALTALLLINVAFGIVTRTAPQLNIFAVGFPVTILAGLFIMFLVMPGFIEALAQLIGSSLQRGLGAFG